MTLRDELRALLERFSDLRVLVVGDLMADEHIWGHVRRISPEAPVPVVEVDSETFVPGGAANTASQLAAFGAKVMVAGAVGADSAGRRLREAFQEMGADTDPIIEASDRPTTRKTRVTASSYQGAQQIVRVDREVRAPLLPADAARLVDGCLRVLPACDALLFSDYVKGVVSAQVVAALAGEARRLGKVVTANPKPSSARFFADADLIQLNRKESDEALRLYAPGALADSPDGLASTDETEFRRAGAALRDALGVRNLLITRGAKGLTVFCRDGAIHHGNPVPVEVFDGTGAGDSTIAGTTLGLAAGGSVLQAVHLGNASGGAVVRKPGVATATRAEVAALL